MWLTAVSILQKRRLLNLKTARDNYKKQKYKKRQKQMNGEQET